MPTGQQRSFAADGASYWVLAHVTPSYGPDGAVIGHHSNRRLSSPGAVARVRPLYARLVAEERRHPDGRAAMAASSRLLTEAVIQPRSRGSGGPARTSPGS